MGVLPANLVLRAIKAKAAELALCIAPKLATASEGDHGSATNGEQQPENANASAVNASATISSAVPSIGTTVSSTVQRIGEVCNFMHAHAVSSTWSDSQFDSFVGVDPKNWRLSH
eukprot:SAG31_NODE_235_length_19695_cov_37.959790_3_plen_115_part_00